MVPSAFVSLEALPLTSNGKVDTQGASRSRGRHAPVGDGLCRSPHELEQRLADIWAQVLNVERVGIHDNFFALGGDSIISLQVIARARQAGIALSARQFFQHQTIAELARIAESTSGSLDEQGPVTGEVLLTPIQHYFLQLDVSHAHHFNLSLLLEARQPLNASLLEKALGHVVIHHDAFRARFTRVEGRWQQHFAGTEAAPTLIQVDLSGLPPASQPAALEAEASRLQASFDLSRPPFLVAALFNLGGSQRLFLCVHHLVIDAVSWRILVEDLEASYLQLLQGQQVTLPPKSTSFQTWARRLSEYAASDALASEAPLWLDEARSLVQPLPMDSSGENTYASAATVSVSLDADETRLLLQEVPAAWRAHINDVLLTALVQSFSDWTGQPRLLVNLEGHGREDLFPDVDLSRTIGWFTSLTPLLLSIPQGGSPGDCLRSVRDSLRQLPHHGLGAGLLQWMGPEALSQKLRALPSPQVAFNYLGQFDASAAASTLFSFASEPTGPIAAPAARRMQRPGGERLRPRGTPQPLLHLQHPPPPALHAPLPLRALPLSPPRPHLTASLRRRAPLHSLRLPPRAPLSGCSRRTPRTQLRFTRGPLSPDALAAGHALPRPPHTGRRRLLRAHLLEHPLPPQSGCIPPGLAGRARAQLHPPHLLPLGGPRHSPAARPLARRRPLPAA